MQRSTQVMRCWFGVDLVKQVPALRRIGGRVDDALPAYQILNLDRHYPARSRTRYRRFFEELLAHPYSSTRRAECASRAETKNWRFMHILGAKQFNKYISDGKRSVYRVKTRLLNLHYRR